MRLTLRALLAVGLLAASSTTSDAETANLLGFGNTSCSEASSLPLDDKAVRDRLFAWAAGFLSGTNVGLMLDHGYFHDLSGVGPQTVTAWLVEYCAKNPQANFADAVMGNVGGLPTVRRRQ